MSDDGSHQDATWPLPRFYFKVESDSLGEMTFQEVAGLDAPSQAVEYRHGENHAFSVVKMPGIEKKGNVILRKGLFPGNSKVFDWFNDIKMNTVKREEVTIKLLDEAGNPKMTGRLTNAWPTKITCGDLNSESNTVVVETLELAYDSLSIEQA